MKPVAVFVLSGQISNKGLSKMSNLRVVVIGASGKMGRAIIQGLSKEADITIVGGIDVHNLGEDIGKLAEFCL